MIIEKLHPQQKVAETLLSLAPREAADILRGFDERELLFAGEAILKYAKRKSHVQRNGVVSDEQGAFSSDSQEVSDHTSDHTSMETDSQFVPTPLGARTPPPVTDDIESTDDTDSQSFLRVTVDDFSPLEVVRALYKISFGTIRAQDLINKLLRLNLNHMLSFLNDYTKHHLFIALEKESIQVISLVLGVLQPHLAAQVLRFFNSDKRCEIIKHIAVQQNPTEDTVKVIEEVLKRKLNKISTAEKHKEDPEGEDKILQILKHLDHSARKSVLDGLENEALKEKLMYTLFNWLDLEYIPQVVVEDIFTHYDNVSIAKFLLIDGEDAENVLSRILSKNRMAMIADELALLKKDLLTHANAIEDAYRMKKQFFQDVREHVYAHAYA